MNVKHVHLPKTRVLNITRPVRCYNNIRFPLITVEVIHTVVLVSFADSIFIFTLSAAAACKFKMNVLVNDYLLIIKEHIQILNTIKTKLRYIIFSKNIVAYDNYPILKSSVNFKNLKRFGKNKV